MELHSTEPLYSPHVDDTNTSTNTVRSELNAADVTFMMRELAAAMGDDTIIPPASAPPLVTEVSLNAVANIAKTRGDSTGLFNNPA